MKKILLSVLMFVCFSGLAFGGDFSELRSYGTCGKFTTSDNECYNVGGGEYVECDDDDGDAPAKTRA
ncbi:MAG: hypothetical protein UIH99_00580 [Alphaproteobacteria bacterium]|nr:hypothetical protein [Alphaproteobacteria bacterium]